MGTDDSRLNILIIGAGMYVSGKGTEEYGTILPALCEWSRQTREPGKIYLAATSRDSALAAQKKLAELNALTGTALAVDFFPKEGRDKHCYQSLLNSIPKPACAIIVTPDHLHSEMTLACFNAGLPVLVVKPLAPDLPAALDMVHAQERTGLYGAVEFHKRFDRANLKLKQAVASGCLGDPLYFLVEYSQRKRIPADIFKAWVHKTNIFQYLGVHYVDIIYFATRARPLRVMAMGQNGWLRQQGIDTFDSVHATIEWESKTGNRFLSYILTNWIDPEKTSAMSDQKIKLIGTKGRYESDQKYRGIRIVSDDIPLEEPNPDFCSTYPLGDGRMTYQGYGIHSIQTFLEDVRALNSGRIRIQELEKTRPTFKESLVSTSVIDAANQSLERRGCWVEIQPAATADRADGEKL